MALGRAYTPTLWSKGVCLISKVQQPSASNNKLKLRIFFNVVLLYLFFVWLFVCLIVCVFVCLIVCLFDCLCVCLIVCLNLHPLENICLYWYVTGKQTLGLCSLLAIFEQLLYRVAPAVTRDLAFCGLSQRTSPIFFSTNKRYWWPIAGSPRNIALHQR